MLRLYKNLYRPCVSCFAKGCPLSVMHKQRNMAPSPRLASSVQPLVLDAYDLASRLGLTALCLYLWRAYGSSLVARPMTDAIDVCD
jgi:hypothetical protein